MNRRGMTFFEAITAIFVAGVLGGVILSVLGRAHWNLQSSNRRRDAEEAASQIARQFREDVHHADAADSRRRSNGPFLTLESANADRIEYAASPERIVRTAFRGAKVESKTAWKIPGLSAASVAEEAFADRRLVTLRYSVAPAVRDAKVRAFAVSARLGFDHRFAPGAAKP